MFSLKDFGYDDFAKNSVVVSKFKAQGKLDDFPAICAAVEKDYFNSASA